MLSIGCKSGRPAFQPKRLGDFENSQKKELDDKDILRRALAELKARKELPVDVKLASDVTNPRNWYHNADSVRQIMRRVCELNDSTVKMDACSKKLVPHKGKMKRLRAIMESELVAAHKMDCDDQSHTDVVHYTHSEKVRVPMQNSDDNDTQSEMKVVITKTSYGNQNTSDEHEKSRKPDAQELKSRGRLTHRLPDLPKFPHPKESCSPSITDSPEPVKVKLPILGKSMAQRNEGDVFTRPLKGDIKRIILGLYGESFDPNTSGPYTYKKVGANRESRDESPVHQVAPKFDERPKHPTSKTLAMFQHKHSADMVTRTVTTKRTRRTKSLKHAHTKSDKAEEPNLLPFPISNWTPREDEKHLLHKQLKLFHQQIAQENIHLLERDFLYRTFPTHPNTAAAFARREKAPPENLIINPNVPDDVAISPDSDLTFVPFMAELEMKLKKKRDRATERRKRLEKIKEMKRLRNPHLETVHPKPRSFAQLIDEQRLVRTAVRPEVLQQKVPMETKVYKIFGERTSRKQATRLDRKLSQSSKISILSQMELERSDYKVKEVC